MKTHDSNILMEHRAIVKNGFAIGFWSQFMTESAREVVSISGKINQNAPNTFHENVGFGFYAGNGDRVTLGACGVMI